MQHDDPANLQFRVRPDRRPRRVHTSNGFNWWWVVAIVGAIVFVLLIHALLDRTASTAGPPPEVRRSPVPEVRYEAPVESWQDNRVAGDMRANRPTVYRCEGAGGAVSLQSEPCAAGQRTTREIPVFQDFRQPPRRSVAAPSSPRYNSSYSSGPSTRNVQLSARRSGCAAARRQRELTLEQVGLRRNYDLLQQLDAMVREACKGL